MSPEEELVSTYDQDGVLAVVGKVTSTSAGFSPSS